MNLEALILSIVLPILTVCLILATVRIVQGPHILDRVLALDFMIVVSVGMLSLYAVASDQPSYLDAAIVVALLSFLGTIGFAHYVELRGTQKGRDNIRSHKDRVTHPNQYAMFHARRSIVDHATRKLEQRGEPS